MFTSRRDFLRRSASLAAMPFVPVLSRSARAADPYVDAVFVPGEPPAFRKGSFSMAVLPDTQHYSEKHPTTYLAQTKWIIENREKRNIQAVLHLGDITNRSTVAEWKNAAKAMNRLDGHVPYFFCPGNHDYSEGGVCKDRTTKLNDYFPVTHFNSLPTFGGTYDKEPTRMENSFHRLTVMGRKFLVLALEFGPRRDVIRWANSVLQANPDREVILITHAHIYFDETRYDWKKYGEKQKWNPHAYAVAKATNDDVSDGEEVWTNLIARHENVILTLNGHVLEDGLGRVTTETPGGRAVQQILVNFQMKPNGGDGWLRLLEFHDDAKTIDVYDYSPTRNACNVSSQNRFAMATTAVKTA